MYSVQLCTTARIGNLPATCNPPPALRAYFDLRRHFCRLLLWRFAGASRKSHHEGSITTIRDPRCGEARSLHRGTTKVQFMQLIFVVLVGYQSCTGLYAIFCGMAVAVRSLLEFLLGLGSQRAASSATGRDRCQVLPGHQNRKMHTSIG